MIDGRQSANVETESERKKVSKSGTRTIRKKKRKKKNKNSHHIMKSKTVKTNWFDGEQKKTFSLNKDRLINEW